MSDETQPPPVERGEIEAEEEILSKFRSKQALKDCPVCGYKDWWVMDVPGETTILAFLNNGRIPTYTLACQNCGFMQQHVRDIIDGTVLPAPKA